MTTFAHQPAANFAANTNPEAPGETVRAALEVLEQAFAYYGLDTVAEAAQTAAEPAPLAA